MLSLWKLFVELATFMGWCRTLDAEKKATSIFV